MNNFEGHIQGDKPVVVDFFAEWCGPCKMMAPVLEQVKEQVGDRITILKMDIDKNPHYTELYGIQAVPTLVIFKRGKVLWRHSGVTPANDILRQLSFFFKSVSLRKSRVYLGSSLNFKHVVLPCYS